MNEEFVKQHNKFIKKHQDAEKELSDLKTKYEEMEVLGLNDEELNQDIHYIAISILEDNTRNKIFRVGKDRTPRGTILFVKGGRVFYRQYQHKIKHEVDWRINNNHYQSDPTILDVMPKKFLEMVKEIEQIKQDYEESIRKTFFREDNNYGYFNHRSDKKKELVYSKNLNFNIYTEKNYIDNSINEQTVNRVELLASMRYEIEKKFNFEIKVFINDKETNNDDNSLKINHKNYPALVNDDLKKELIKAIKEARGYCQKWLDKRIQVRKKIDEVIEKYNYIDVLAVSRI